MTHFPELWSTLLRAHANLELTPLLSSIEVEIERRESAGANVFPPPLARYLALQMVTPDSCRVCILGQDPYHGLTPDGAPEAMGLSFSVPDGVRIPPSLRNIFKELQNDVGGDTPRSGDLSHWAEQGVLLLNTVLSVEKDTPKSHDKLGWQIITAGLLQALSIYRKDLVFILWGNSAKSMKEHIASNGHTVIESSHPSPIGGSCNKGFFGSRPFSRANEALVRAGHSPITWNPSAGGSAVY